MRQDFRLGLVNQCSVVTNIDFQMYFFFFLFAVFATVVMVFGKLLFGFVLGNVASTMANAEALRVNFEEQFSAVQTHMKDQKLPFDMQERVVKFFQYIWSRNRY